MEKEHLARLKMVDRGAGPWGAWGPGGTTRMPLKEAEAVEAARAGKIISRPVAPVPEEETPKGEKTEAPKTETATRKMPGAETTEKRGAPQPPPVPGKGKKGKKGKK